MMTAASDLAWVLDSTALLGLTGSGIIVFAFLFSVLVNLRWIFTHYATVLINSCNILIKDCCVATTASRVLGQLLLHSREFVLVLDSKLRI